MSHRNPHSAAENARCAALLEELVPDWEEKVEAWASQFFPGSFTGSGLSAERVAEARYAKNAGAKDSSKGESVSAQDAAPVRRYRIAEGE